MPRQRLALVVAGVLVLTAAVLGHDVPNDVVVHAFIKPERESVRVLVRVPLEALRDIDVPTRGEGYLDLARAEPVLRDAATVWIARELELYQDDRQLAPSRVAAVRVSLPADPSFQAYDRALAHVTGPPLDPGTDVYWNQGVLDVLIEYGSLSEGGRLAIRPGFERLGLRTTTVLRLVTPDGAVRGFEMHGDPGVVRLDPTWIQAAMRFVRLGFEHILSGTDHLLFVLCLVIPLRRVRTLVAVVTAFTIAHSVTLLASAYDMAPTALWFPPLVETLIAASIGYMAIENIVGVNTTRRWVVAFAFGLVHGFGFSFALRETLQFAGSHLLTSLLSFNVGVELGQLVVLAAAVPGIALLVRRVDERIGTIVLSAIVAHTAWHWMLERGERLMQFPAPAVNPAALAGLIRWVMLAVAVAGVCWMVYVLVRPRPRAARRSGAEGGIQ